MYYQRFGKDAEPEFAHLVKGVDLFKFLYRRVRVTLRNGGVCYVKIYHSSIFSVSPTLRSSYPFCIPNLEVINPPSAPLYTQDGRFREHSISDEDIIKIEELEG